MKRSFFIALLLIASSASAQLYRWLDAEGKVHYSDSPPPPNAKSVQRKNFKGSAVDTSDMPYALQQAVRDFPVTLYTSPDCKQFCYDARDLLNKRGVPFKEVSVSDPASMNELKKVSGGALVPVITVGNQVHKGYEQGAYRELLDSAGYPRNAMPRNQIAPPAPAPAPIPADAAKGDGNGAPAAKQ